MNKKYNGALDFWKFVFCLVILVFHIGEAYGGKKGYILEWGRYAVEVFFIISGYFMCVSATKAEERQADISLGKETFGFILHKIKRILPAYLFCYVLGIGVWFVESGQYIFQESGLLGLFIKTVKMLPNFLLLFMSGVQGTKVVMITWYISAMLIAMLVIYPLLRKYKDMYTLVVAPVTALLISGYFYNVSGYNGFDAYDGVITHGILRAVVGINIGCLAYMLAEYMKTKDYSKSVRILLACAEIGLYLLTIFMMHNGGKKCVFYNNILILFAVAITASKQSAVSKWFDNKVSRFLGEASLYIYLCQSPARVAVRYVFPDISYGTAFLYIGVLTIALAALGMVIVKAVSTAVGKKKQLAK